MQRSCISNDAAEPDGCGGDFGSPSTKREEKMRKTISVAALLLALTYPAYAGEIQNEAPKPPTATAQEPSTEGEMQNGATDSLTQTVLDLFAALPSLF
jgi:hypothetical protein